ncbi:13348_t:CDS:2, partial [Dentiscutata heterogama]
SREIKMLDKYKLKKLGKELDENLNDWKTLYQNILDAFKIQYNPVSQCAKTEFLVIDLVIDLNKVFANRERIEARIIRIFGDVVQIPENLVIRDLDDDYNVILIVARRIEIKPGCRIFVNNEKKDPFRLVIYAMEIPLDLIIEIKSIHDTVTNKFTSNRECKHIGGMLSMQDGRFEYIKYFEKFDTNILQKKAFNKMLQFSLQIACALFYDEPKITQSILTWIIEITAQSQSEMVKEIYYHGLAVFERFKILKERMERTNQVRFVPPLDKKQYWKYIEAFMKTVNSYEIEYLTLLENRDINKLERKKLKLLLNDCNDAKQMFQRFEEESNNLYQSSYEVIKKAKGDLEKRKEEVINARIAFEDGINEWRRKQKFAAKKQIAIDIFEILLIIGKIIIQSGSIIGLIKTVKDVSNSIQNIFKDIFAKKIMDIFSSDDVEKIEKLYNPDDATKIMKLNDIIKEIIKSKHEIESYREIAKERTNIKDEDGEIELLNIDKLAKVLETKDQKGILLSTEWKLIHENIEKLLKLPIDKKIEGAKEYLNSLKNFFLFIDSYIKAKIEETKNKREYSRTQLHVETFKRKENRLKTMIEEFELNQDYYNNIALLLFENLINLRCWIMVYMENYRCAFEYWSLSESKLKLSVIKNFNEYEKDINNELVEIYKKFNGPPQEFKLEIDVVDGNQIEEFKRNGSVTIDIPLDHPKLSMIDNARLHEFQVFLIGVGSINDEISLSINSSNSFFDRYKGINYKFKTVPRRSQLFTYKSMDNYA